MKSLRSGFTTGACAAAGAKAAFLYGLYIQKQGPFQDCLVLMQEKKVSVPFPNGNRFFLKIDEYGFDDQKGSFFASVIKDAGDDPDVTHGALIVVELRYMIADERQVVIKGGEGVGLVTKPGLPVEVGEHAINPVPRRMIRAAIEEVMDLLGRDASVEVVIHVPEGNKLAKKTLNPRLGIQGGISILGTTGIVRPLSTEAWTESITSQLRVAKAVGLKEVVLSTGRTSERAHMSCHGYPEEAYIMAGDHMDHAICEAKKMGFSRITISAQFAKLIKIALGRSNTHVRYGPLDPKEASSFFGLYLEGLRPNTVRELLQILLGLGQLGQDVLRDFCMDVAKKLCMAYGLDFCIALADYNGKIIMTACAR